MLKKKIKFEDFNGQQAEETHFFHLSKADLVELEMTHKGGLQAYIQRVVDSNDGKAIIDEFKRLILMAYGKKNEDGTRFLKSEDLRQDFLASPAYDALFMELVTDADKAAEFVNSIIPTGMDAEVAKVAKPARTVNEVIEAERIKENGLDEPAENVFENNVPIPDDANTLTPEAQRMRAEHKSTDLVGHPTGRPDRPQLDARLLTTQEVREMDADQLKLGLATGAFRLS